MPAPQRSPTRSRQWFRSSCGTAASLPLGSHHYARDSRFSRAGLKPAPCSASAEQRTVRTAAAGPRERSKSQQKPRNALLPPASKGQRCPTGSGREGAGWDGRSHTRDPHPTLPTSAGQGATGHLCSRSLDLPKGTGPLMVPSWSRGSSRAVPPQALPFFLAEAVLQAARTGRRRWLWLSPATLSSLQTPAERLFLHLPFPVSSPTPVFIESASFPMLKKIPHQLGAAWTQHYNYQVGKKRHWTDSNLTRGTSVVQFTTQPHKTRGQQAARTSGEGLPLPPRPSRTQAPQERCCAPLGPALLSTR